jgi:hypothetical protein
VDVDTSDPKLCSALSTLNHVLSLPILIHETLNHIFVSLPLSLALHELQRFLYRNCSYRGDAIRECHTITLLGHSQHLRSECRADELPALVLVHCGRQLVEMFSDCSSILRIEVGINLIEEIEWRWITCLDGEDQRQGAQTCHS